MIKHSAIGLLVFVLFVMVACQSVHVPPEDRPPSEPTTTPENTLYTDMTTYGQDMGCGAAIRNVGLPEAGWEQAPSLPGTYEEYLGGWREGFNKCRIGLGPVVPPDGVYP
ncbi:hypothetical protein [Endozoicomonas sp.]|uniref:hypothetical protein n=1 Tax=Endozoicomonas sp. TaxID=1892382 RepID=UPI0028866B42|nr:hypothetical protein [Endozoicomonas sp.]